MSATACCDGPFDNHILYKSLRNHNPLEHSKWQKRFLNCSDSLMSLLLIAPLVVAYWRGTWGWMDEHPNIFPAMNCFLFGALIHCCLCVSRELLHTKCNFLKFPFIKSFHLFIIKKIYTYIFSIGCIMHW